MIQQESEEKNSSLHQVIIQQAIQLQAMQLAQQQALQLSLKKQQNSNSPQNTQNLSELFKTPQSQTIPQMFQTHTNTQYAPQQENYTNYNTPMPQTIPQMIPQTIPQNNIPQTIPQTNPQIFQQAENFSQTPQNISPHQTYNNSQNFTHYTLTPHSRQHSPLNTLNQYSSYTSPSPPLPSSRENTLNTSLKSQLLQLQQQQTSSPTPPEDLHLHQIFHQLQIHNNKKAKELYHSHYSICK